jgi:surface polysaccharide O-acyltransferase-like enzyme
MVGFIILVYKKYDNYKKWFWIWVASAVLINPLLKIALGGTIWNIMDIVWAVLLIISIFKKSNEIDESNKKTY